MLSSEHIWLYFGVIRQKDMASRVSGGLSGVCRAILNIFFTGVHSFLSGVTVHFGDEAKMLRARLCTILGDEAALKSIWSVKGAAGHKCCFKCINIVSNQSGLADVAPTPGALLPARTVAVDRIQFHTDESLWTAADRAHAARHGPVGVFQALQIAVGISHNPAMLLLDASLRSIARPITVTLFDWVHVWLCNGVANFELFECLKVLKHKDVVFYPAIDRFFQLWTWPARSRNAPKRAFGPARANASTDKFKAGASELIDSYPVLRCLFDNGALERAVAHLDEA